MFKRLGLSLLVIMFLATTTVGQQVKKAQNKDPQDAEASKPKVGDQAPDWELMGSDGKKYKLSSYKGKQAVVVAWYPAALTGG
jgi:peroxiredoxin